MCLIKKTHLQSSLIVTLVLCTRQIFPHDFWSTKRAFRTAVFILFASLNKSSDTSSKNFDIAKESRQFNLTFQQEPLTQLLKNFINSILSILANCTLIEYQALIKELEERNFQRDDLLYNIKVYCWSSTSSAFWFVHINRERIRVVNTEISEWNLLHTVRFKSFEFCLDGGIRVTVQVSPKLSANLVSLVWTKFKVDVKIKLESIRRPDVITSNYHGRKSFFYPSILRKFKKSFNWRDQFIFLPQVHVSFT